MKSVCQERTYKQRSPEIEAEGKREFGTLYLDWRFKTPTIMYKTSFVDKKTCINKVTWTDFQPVQPFLSFCSWDCFAHDCYLWFAVQKKASSFMPARFSFPLNTCLWTVGNETITAEYAMWSHAGHQQILCFWRSSFGCMVPQLWFILSSCTFSALPSSLLLAPLSLWC